MKSLEELDINKKESIIFDLDGTLIDSIGIWNLTDMFLIKKYGRREVTESEIQQVRDEFLHTHTKGEIYNDYCSELIKKYKLDINDGAVLAQIRRDLYKEMYEEYIDYKPHVIETINELKRLKKTIVLATMSSEEQIKKYSRSPKLIAVANIRDLFDYITLKENVKHTKPDPEIYLNVLRKISLSPDKCLTIEDSYSGCLASKRAQIETLNIYDKYSDKDREQINRIVDYSIKDYNEILRRIKKR